MTSTQLPCPLPRVPLVPDELLKRNHCYFEIDTRFRKAARLLSCLWLKDHSIEPGVHVRGEGADAVVMPLHSNLSRDAARAGKNFLSPAIHEFVRRELIMREEGAAIDEERLLGNALSSMPMSYNLFAPMALDLSLATAVFKQLLPEFVHEVTEFKFEHSPSRERRKGEWLEDGSAFDLAVKVITVDGEDGTVLIETKLSEDMAGPAARLRDRYDEVSRASGLFVDPDSPMLRTYAQEQLWRLHMLSQLMVDKGVTSRAVFIAIGPRLNRRAMAAFRSYEKELIAADDRDTNRVPFQALTLETVVEAIGRVGAPDLSRQLWARYCDFERIYHLALQEFVDKQTGPNETGPSSQSAPQQSNSRPAQVRSRKKAAQ
jgi:hypothetical protein